ncbi:MAG TPA: lantibiotic dehydratase [Umezawaea sp.]|nr:lantibiotic dehydratase [Umezawaea sp.]
MAVSVCYRHAGLVLVRASTDPGDLTPPPPGALDPATLARDGRAWLSGLWSRADVREAVRLASPAFGERMDRLVTGPASSMTVKQWRRAVLSMASYVLRWQRRATPFGMFAAVGTATIGAATAQVGMKHHARVRVGSEWITALIDRLEHHAALRSRLGVLANSSATVRDGRVIVAARVAADAATPGPVRELSAAFTRPVQVALAEAATPTPLAAVTGRMIARFTQVSPSAIRTLLDGLVEGGFLVTSLRPPMTSLDPLEHLAGALRAAGVDDLPDLVVLLRELDGISARIAHHNRTADLVDAADVRDAVTTRMTALAPSSAPVLAVDVKLDAMIAVPLAVLSEATAAAEVLLRLGASPFGSMVWLDYHSRFLARYGHGALVPVRDVVADSGLGFPHGYLGAPAARPSWRTLTERDAALLALIQRATMDGSDEIVLSSKDIDTLAVGDHADMVPPDRVELGVAVHAESTTALERGAFILWVNATPHTQTSMAGRFAHLLDDTDRARLVETYTAGGDNLDVVAMQLSFPPRRPHNDNVTRVPPLLPDVVSLSEYRDDSPIGVDDLAVTADATQLYLVQRSTGRRVIPRIPHALDLTVQTPPLARFLAEVADARSAVFSGFDLGAARTLPYIPRIRYRRTVLSAARWLLTATDLPRHGTDEQWQQALLDWRRRQRVPSRIVLHQGELRLPLDLDHHVDRVVLRTRLRTTDRAELREDGQPGCHGWIGRPAELLIPMTATHPVTRPLPATASASAAGRPGDGEVLHAQLVGNPARFDDILTRHLPRLADQLAERIERWWVRRHHDLIHPKTDHHLAICLRLSDPDQYGLVAAIVAAFANDLHDRGLPAQLLLTPYHRHPGRYGEGPAGVVAEHVFATDTAAALAQITVTQSSNVPAPVLAAVSMARLAADFATEPDHEYQALPQCLPREHGPLDQSLRDQVLRLADPTDGWHAVRALPGGNTVVDRWDARATALRAYHRVLVQQRDPSTVLRTLLHEHHVRAVGVDPDVEKTTGRLARAAAYRCLALAGIR